MLKTEWKEQGFIDEPVTEGTDLKAIIDNYVSVGKVKNYS